jgi:hypothetical protein
MMSPSKHPISYYFCNKFVLTEDGSYFVPYGGEFCFPPIVDILREIFDLDDPKVYREVRDRLAVGTIIVGDYFPSIKDVIVEVPIEMSGYVEKRIEEVFGEIS